MYIIGGLVDHNAHKNICLKRAEKQGIGHGQLPIGEYVKLATRKVHCLPGEHTHTDTHTDTHTCS